MNLTSTIEVRRLGLMPYEQAWALQREIHADVVAGTQPPTLLLLEHPSVYTAGRRTETHERPMDGTAVIDVDRGGKITWHGPGQLVAYPILPLPPNMGVVDYVRALESILITSCARFGVSADRVEGRSGAWVAAERKIAAIGVRVERNTTLHGFALNVDPDLSAFHLIVPCGIADAGVTSLSQETGRSLTVSEVLPVVEAEFLKVLG